MLLFQASQALVLLAASAAPQRLEDGCADCYPVTVTSHCPDTPGSGGLWDRCCSQEVQCHHAVCGSILEGAAEAESRIKCFNECMVGIAYCVQPNMAPKARTESFNECVRKCISDTEECDYEDECIAKVQSYMGCKGQQATMDACMSNESARRIREATESGPADSGTVEL
mmetsp:Transcript_30511/g.78966  ORF Transcript_30511/g.78966 Transcript_30511/m.78966 type:complete len:170 (+) Transcript_30511:57-566(+)